MCKVFRPQIQTKDSLHKGFKVCYMQTVIFISTAMIDGWPSYRWDPLRKLQRL